MRKFLARLPLRSFTQKSEPVFSRLSAHLFPRLFSIDGRSLAAFRIGVGALVLVDLWTRSTAIEQHYTDAGVLPREAYTRLLSVSDWQWSIHFLTGDVAGQSTLFLLAAAAAFALIAGYRTRAASILSWALLVSLQTRNPMLLYGADQLLRLLLFWSMFLPLGSMWLLDRRRTDSNTDGMRDLSIASAALLLQPCVMYLFSGLLKWNTSWESGNALGYALSADMYVTPLGQMLASFPTIVAMLGALVPWIEILAPVGLFMPWSTAAFRTITLAFLVVFHAAIAATLHTGLFPLVVFVSLVPFVPALVWDRLGIGRTDVAPLRTGNVAEPPRRISRMARQSSLVLQASVAALVLYGLAWNVVGINVHDYAARNALTWMKEWWSEGRSGVPLSFRDYAVERRMGPFGWIGRVTGLHQRWDMFERAGPEMRGWPLVVGTLTDGQKVNVLGADVAGKAGARIPPEAPLAFYPGTRWLVYFTYLRTSGTKAARELLPAVVTRDWERRYPGKQIDSMQILFVQPSVATSRAATGMTSSAGDRLVPVRTADVWYDGPANGH